MRIARVIGNVVVSQVADRLDGPNYLLVEPTTTSGEPSGGPMVAVDAVQAGPGDLVIVSQGSSCRQIRRPESIDTVDKAVDALVVGVIDLVDDRGKVTYRAAGSDSDGRTAGAKP